MSLRFPYIHYPVQHPLPSLSGQTFRPRPVIGVTLIGPSGTRVERCLLDTGADDTLFPENLAALIGVDLSNAPTGTGTGVGMQPMTIRFAEVVLRIADNLEHREWKAWVGFTSAKLRQPLLGYTGFLQYFITTFYGDLEEVELTVNATYPGS